jgi:hypothetical protein
MTKVGWGGWSKLLLISSIGAGVAAPVGYVTWNRLHTSREESAKVVASHPPTPPPPVKNEPVVAPPAEAASAESESAEPAAPPAKADAKAASSRDLAAELGALDAARAELSAGNANGALAKLDDYSRSYPHGHLVLEAEVLRIDALAKSGQTSTAKKRAEAFLRRHPNSVLASRVRGYLN